MSVSRSGNTWLLGLLVGVLLIFAAGLRSGRERPETKETKEMDRRSEFLRNWKAPLPLRTEAPGFSLKDRSGRTHSLSEFRGQPTLLCFYSDDKRSRTWAREMQKLWNHIGKSKMRSVVVVNFSPEAALAFAGETKDASIYLFEDPDHHPVRDRYGAAPGPNAWVLDATGYIRHASAPIQTDKNPDQDFFGVYKALQGLTQSPLPNSSPVRAMGKPSPAPRPTPWVPRHPHPPANGD